MAATELIKSALFGKPELKAYYRFESGAETTDSSGNSRTLSAISSPSGTTGKFGNGISLNGSSAYSAADNADFKPTGSFTAIAWVSTATAACSIFQSQSYAGGVAVNGWMMFLSGGIPYYRHGWNSSFSDLSGVSTINDSAFHQVVITWNTATKKIYIDGKLTASAAETNVPTYAGTNYVRIGCQNDSGSNANFITGTVDDVTLLNGVALTAEQIRELYEGRSIGELWPQANLKGLWHLNGNSKDYSGNDNSGTDTAITYSLANGKFNQGAGFARGSSSAIVLPNAAVLKPTAAVTVIQWYKTTNSTNRQVMWSSSEYVGSLQSGVLLDISTNADGKLRFVIGRNTGSTAGVDYKVIDDTASSADGNWHMAAVTHDSSTMKLYRDGNLFTSAAYAYAIGYPATAYIQIGAGHYLGALIDFMDGKLDETVFFDSALSASAIKRIYANGAGKFY